MKLFVSGGTATMREHCGDPNLGVLFVPGGNRHEPTNILWPGCQWAADNGAFKDFDTLAFVRMLERLRGVPGCAFIACPDVVGNAKETRRRFDLWEPMIHALGFPVALVSQDGLTGDKVPWDRLDAMFIGGSTEWKLSHDAAVIGAYAKAHGKWLHMGRVNSRRRLTYAYRIGCDSIDGTAFSRWPAQFIAKGLHWIAVLKGWDMPTAPFLPGFTRADSVVKRRLILSVEGLEGCGKTRFTLTAPGPIAFINFDYGLEGVVEQFQKQKPIYVATVKLDFKGGKEQIISAAEKELDKVETNYQTALKQARTIVIDTGSELWELLRLAAFGKLDKVMPHQYTEVNQQMVRLLNLAYDSDANLLMTHRLKEQWVNDKRTGLYEFAGMKEIPFRVQAHARMWTDDEHKYHLQVGKCRQNASVVGLELVNDMITFSTLAQFVFPESEEKDWA